MILKVLDVTMAWKEISAICLISIVIMMALPTVSASKASLSDLKSTISSFDRLEFVSAELSVSHLDFVPIVPSREPLSRTKPRRREEGAQMSP